jgi:F0F1-type ATP synthase assembly protein I
LKNKRSNEHNTDLWEVYQKAEPYLGLGITFTVTILAFLFLGRWLDTKLGTEPWLMLLGSAVGLTLGFVHMVYTLLDETDNKTDNDHSGE